MKKNYVAPKADLLEVSLNDAIAAECSHYIIWEGPNDQDGNNGMGTYVEYDQHHKALTEKLQIKINQLPAHGDDLNPSGKICESWEYDSCFSS